MDRKFCNFMIMSIHSGVVIYAPYFGFYLIPLGILRHSHDLNEIANLDAHDVTDIKPIYEMSLRTWMQVQSDTCTLEDLKTRIPKFLTVFMKIEIEQEWRFLVFGLLALGYSGFLSIAAYGMLAQ